MENRIKKRHERRGKEEKKDKHEKETEEKLP